jgi:cell division transport system permease protein
VISRWLRLHWQNLGGAFGRLGNSPVGAALNILVIAIALALPAALQLLLVNASSMAPAFEDAADLTVYLNAGVAEDDGRQLADEIGARTDVAATRFISNTQGLEELKSRAGFEGALEALTDNPIPHVIKVRPASERIDEIDALAADLAALGQAELVQLDRLWVGRLQAILALGRRAVGIVTGLLAAAVILVIGNTIRLEINNRRTEIEVMKLVGATDGFIRRPFLYSGLVLGAIGAIAAAALISTGLWLLVGPVAELATLYASDFTLSGLAPGGFGVLVGAGALLGWAGAWIAAARHLRAIEPA